MIARLRGRLLEKHPNRVIVDVAGVGYDVHVPLSSFYALGEPGGDVQFHIHTHVREDALQLFGFRTPAELQIFERLISISGIGPKLALAVLSGIEPADLATAVEQGDIARLTGIPGIGRKTAERIALELKGKLISLAAPGPDAPAGPREDVISALVNLGYHRPAAERAADAAVKAAPDARFEDTLRQALRVLTK